MGVVQVVLATPDDQDILAKLMTPYLFEFGVSVDYQYLKYYWTEPDNRFPYLIKVDSTIAGFALVRYTRTFEIAEFYVAPECRGNGIGRSAVEYLFDKHHGNWVIKVARDNSTGNAFWKKALGKYVYSISSEPKDENCIAFTLNTQNRT